MFANIILSRDLPRLLNCLGWNTSKGSLLDPYFSPTHAPVSIALLSKIFLGFLLPAWQLGKRVGLPLQGGQAAIAWLNKTFLGVFPPAWGSECLGVRLQWLLFAAPPPAYACMQYWDLGGCLRSLGPSLPHPTFKKCHMSVCGSGLYIWAQVWCWMKPEYFARRCKLFFPNRLRWHPH